MSHSNNVKNLLSKYIDYLNENPLKHCICALDYSSLYPSLIMTYNLSPEYLILDKEFKEEVRNKGENIHNINFEYNYENYLGEKNTKYIEAWTVRHDESKEITKFGLYPTILKDLFAQRAKMKKELFIYKEKKEHIESVETDYLDNPEYKECIFKLNYCDTKQKALKVFMNTFYGELGNKNSPLFVLELAGAVTSSGQANLLLVKDYVEKLGHKVYYGDTDSLYISCPESYYLEKNKEYYTEQINKLQYNTDLVTITFKAIEDIKVKVNDYLYQNNGTKYLKMAYEEILWPCAFLSKKKYFGIPHENIPNFKPADMFIRGLEVKKRGVSEILKIICLDIMWESLDLKNTKTLRELIIQKIKEIFIKKWELKDFIQTGLWKPEKKNVTLNEFAERMKEENKTIPEPGERFNYVIIKKYPYKYDFKGRQIPLKKADKMEYLETVIDNNYEIDLKYYFDNQLSGQFARLLSYDNEFTEYSIDEDTGQFEYDDNKTLTKCKKYILQLVEMHGNNYIDRNKVFKNIYKEVSKKYKDIKYTKISIETYNKKYDILFNTLNNASDDSSNLYKLINDNIEKYVNKTYNFSILSNNIIKKYKKNDKSLIQLYNGKNTSFYKLQQNELNLRYSTKLDIFLKNIIEKKLSNIIFNIDNMNIINIIQHIRQKYNIDKICGSQEEIDTIYDIIDENELEINLLDIDLYTKIDPDLIKKIYNDYIHLIALKKLNILHTYIYNNIHIVKSSTDKDIKKPYGFKF
jgi:hypothetical protein